MNGEETEAGKEESMKKKRVRLKETEIHAAFQGYQMVKLQKFACPKCGE